MIEDQQFHQLNYCAYIRSS